MPILIKASDENVDLAVELLKTAQAVVLPTETVYGLAADACSDVAVASVYELKSRPSFNPLICHVDSIDSALKWGDFSSSALKLAEAFWPGPLTLVVTRRDGYLSSGSDAISLLASAGLSTIGIRVPCNKFMRDVSFELGRPLAAPSANPSESISPTCASHVFKGFCGSPNLHIFDGGECSVGVESTIVDVSSDVPVILRYGGIAVEELTSALGSSIQLFESDGVVKSPGQMRRHYAPSKPMRINAQKPSSDSEAFICFGPQVMDSVDGINCNKEQYFNLSENGNLQEAACNLFKIMHFLDSSDFSSIAVQSIPMIGLGCAINDRISRASQVDSGAI